MHRPLCRGPGGRRADGGAEALSRARHRHGREPQGARAGARGGCAVRGHRDRRAGDLARVGLRRRRAHLLRGRRRLHRRGQRAGGADQAARQVDATIGRDGLDWRIRRPFRPQGSRVRRPCARVGHGRRRHQADHRAADAAARPHRHRSGGHGGQRLGGAGRRAALLSRLLRLGQARSRRGGVGRWRHRCGLQGVQLRAHRR
mmetsp:Transcript_3329/g.6909  ORF Transcript_3329/g.6909 Transcript_3329/m.6909 type:complete len:202 (+) Transcript_3329:777-1382(+)